MVDIFFGVYLYSHESMSHHYSLIVQPTTIMCLSLLFFDSANIP